MDTATHTDGRRIALLLVVAVAGMTLGGQRPAPVREPPVIHGADAVQERAIDWSIVGAAAVLRGDRVQVAITGLGSRPVRATGFEEVVNGGGSLEDAARRAGEGTSPLDDLDGSAEYKQHLAGVLARRAVQAARER